MPGRNILDKEKPLHKSLLWKLQENAYSQFGPKAWSEKGVPFYVTSNPWTAKAYAHLVLGYLRDVKLDFKEPLYLLDLGAGTGRFAYLFLKEFFKLIKGLRFEKLAIRYVMTDFTENNLTYWRTHPLLKPYFAKGVLDCCLYHHAGAIDGATLTRENIKNPLIVIANYFFDTIPQELFRVKNGKLEEGLITLSTRKKWKDKTNPELINDLVAEYSYRKIDKPSPFLMSYLKEFENSSFLIPAGAFQVIDHFLDLSNGRMLLLAGDQGFVTKEEVILAGEPKIALHGSFSIAVSYHAIASYIRYQKGDALLASMPEPSFAFIAGLFPGKNYPETDLAFKTFIDAFEPRDYWRLSLEAEKENPSLELLLLLIKLGNFDPMAFYGYFDKIRAKLPAATQQNRESLKKILPKIEEHFYPIAKEDNAFAYNLGVLYNELGDLKKAFECFERATKMV